MSKTDHYLKLVNVPWKMRLYLLYKLPAAWFMGINVRFCDKEKSEVNLPYGWRSKNPFKSTYFAAQCAAGEFSTGILATAMLQDYPPTSMLVTHIEAKFYKKATEMLVFSCEQGREVAETIQRAQDSGEAQTLQMVSLGKLPDGTLASEVRITWSFKTKNSQR